MAAIAIYIIWRSSCRIILPKQLPFGTRWIARTVDEDALGMCLPATAEHKGRLYCRAHHQQRMLKTGKTVRYHIETGLLSKADAAAMKKLIVSSF